ncbi:unnamed protein product [Lampetra fluviatilis]
MDDVYSGQLASKKRWQHVSELPPSLGRCPLRGPIAGDSPDGVSPPDRRPSWQLRGGDCDVSAQSHKDEPRRSSAALSVPRRTTADLTHARGLMGPAPRLHHVAASSRLENESDHLPTLGNPGKRFEIPDRRYFSLDRTKHRLKGHDLLPSKTPVERDTTSLLALRKLSIHDDEGQRSPSHGRRSSNDRVERADGRGRGRESPNGYLPADRNTASPVQWRKTQHSGSSLLESRSCAPRVAKGDWGHPSTRLARGNSDGKQPMGSPTSSGLHVDKPAWGRESLDVHQQSGWEAEVERLWEGFDIPVLPRGQHLLINICSTWGDRHYVGLNGIEVFADTGEPVQIADVVADPADINVLPEYGRDPRVAANLVDGVYRTQDDGHLWLAPFTPGAAHLVHLAFAEPCHVAMIRVWNYNKSRIHACRGARHLDISLDGVLVFSGEIAKASGTLRGGAEQFGDTILFTTDDSILEAMAQHDQTFQEEWKEEESGEELPNRPRTSDRDADERPITCAALPSCEQQKGWGGHSTVVTWGAPPARRSLCGGLGLQLNVTHTWGDELQFGLTGLEVVGASGDALPVTAGMLSAPSASAPGSPASAAEARHESPSSGLDRILDGENVTMCAEHMCSLPFTPGRSHLLVITLARAHTISGLRFWNYNRSPEDTSKGVRTVHVALDGRVVSPPEGILLRKGPGNCHFDFAQEIIFREFSPGSAQARAQQTSCRQIPKTIEQQSMAYEAPAMPCGFIFQLQLLTSWGDPYYIGLNGLEIYDAEGQLIPLTENHMTAFPDSVNVLEGVCGDVRTPDKLIDGVNDTHNGRHMWLAPILPGVVNRVYIIFDHPTSVSMVKLWNYSKTPSRGVKEFGVLVDDLLVYNGTLEQISGVSRRGSPYRGSPRPSRSPVPCHTVLFTDEPSLVTRERRAVPEPQALNEMHMIYAEEDDDDDIQLFDSGRVLRQRVKPVDQALRPMTCIAVRGQSGKK